MKLKLNLLNISTAVGLIAACILGFLFLGFVSVDTNAEYGVTFSRYYAQDELGLNADDVLAEALDDLGIRRFRLGAYWKFLEPQPDEWNFGELDRDIKAVGDRGGKVVLAVGEKLPHWPECWTPDWWKNLPRDLQQPLTLKYIETVVRRYKDNPTIIAWQIENEPHFSYGDCLVPDPFFIRQEVGLVRTLDPDRPVVTTDSGELSLWITFGTLVDKLGVSTYRVVKMSNGWIFRYSFMPPYFYQRKAMLAKMFGVKNVYVSEFQMEPWSNIPLTETPIDEQLKTMDIEQMQSNFLFAEQMHLSPIDFWGMEWWYWMKEKKNHPEFWEEAKSFYQRQ
ncbi:MAG: beta-galactosidase [Patescibacteria group bacterium]|nr:beta-galactosidase [Patescibacteria group bacterium]MBU2509028.1 beta-galactosidase [Patescibacteria group bacterium]